MRLKHGFAVPPPSERSARGVCRSGLAVLLVLVPLLLPMEVPARSADALSKALGLPKASLIAEQAGRTVIARQPDQPMVPASTMKILTALAAIQRWGLDHRFHTDFYRSADDWLWVKGYGDPFLVSQELDAIAATLKHRGILSVSGIGADDSYFSPEVEISGRSSTSNPYDAPISALAANFNTVDVRRSSAGWLSAEPETPLTPLALSLAVQLGAGETRVNLREREHGVRYFGELLAAKLAAAGIQVASEVRIGRVPSDAQRIYRHANSRDLRGVLVAMLKYSNNFIANDLFLLLADHGDGRPVSMPEAQRAAADWVNRTFRWRDFRIEDGAGLSRGNRLSARQLLDTVKAFGAYRDLLPEHGGRVMAKTGTLTGVSCYAGFVQREGRWEPFSLMINQPVTHDFRLQVANDLADAPDLDHYCPPGGC